MECIIPQLADPLELTFLFSSCSIHKLTRVSTCFSRSSLVWTEDFFLFYQSNSCKTSSLLACKGQGGKSVRTKRVIVSHAQTMRKWENERKKRKIRLIIKKNCFWMGTWGRKPSWSFFSCKVTKSFQLWQCFQMFYNQWDLLCLLT